RSSSAPRRSCARSTPTAALHPRTAPRSTRSPSSLHRCLDPPAGYQVANQLPAELDAHALGRAHQLARRIDQLELLDRLLDRLGHQLAVLHRGDTAELALGDQLDRLDP